MAILLETRSLNYDDVNLIAQFGKVESRSDIPIEGWRIVISAMTSIIGKKFLKACSDLEDCYKPTIHVPRDIFWKDNLNYLNTLDYPKYKVFVGVGVNTPKIIDFCEKYGFEHLLLDVANGYAKRVLEAVKGYREKGFYIAAGSVHTKIGLENLICSGAYIVRSGIAPGSVCITSDSTGFTRGTFTEIHEMYQCTKSDSSFESYGTKILADGGFKAPAHYVKSFLAGASYCMSGRPFVNAKECRMHTDETNIDVNRKLRLPCHTYFGMASKWGQLAFGKKSEEIRYIEGREEYIDPENNRPLKDIIEDIWEGIRSGISYSGFSTLTDAIGNGVFEVK